MVEKYSDCGKVKMNEHENTMKRTILLVDDEPENLTIVSVLLGNEYEVLTVQSGKEALELLDVRQDVEIIISDQRMPRMTGVELLQQVRITRPSVARLILTGYGGSQELCAAVENGDVHCIFDKPFEIKAMRETLKEVFQWKDAWNAVKEIHKKNS